MMEILDDRGLSFLFPLLRVQNDLWKQFKVDPSPNNIYKWIKDNVDIKLYTNPAFINILMTKLVRILFCVLIRFKIWRYEVRS